MRRAKDMAIFWSAVIGAALVLPVALAVALPAIVWFGAMILFDRGAKMLIKESGEETRGNDKAK